MKYIGYCVCLWLLIHGAMFKMPPAVSFLYLVLFVTLLFFHLKKTASFASVIGSADIIRDLICLSSSAELPTFFYMTFCWPCNSSDSSRIIPTPTHPRDILTPYSVTFSFWISLPNQTDVHVGYSVLHSQKSLASNGVAYLTFCKNHYLQDSHTY